MADQTFDAHGTVTLDASQFNSELKKVLGTLNNLTTKLGDLDKVSFSTLSKSVADMEKDLSGLEGSLSSTGNIGKRHANSRIRKINSEARLNNAQASYLQADADLLSQQAKNYLTILDNTTKKTAAYAESVSKQIDKNMKEALAKSKISEADSRNRLRSIQGTLLEQSGQRRFTNGIQGGIAQILTRGTTHLKNRGGVTSLMTTIGERVGANPSSFLGNKLGGILKGGTAGGLGVNAAGLAMGGFTLAIGKAVEGLYKFSKASLDAYGSMQKLSVNLDVVYGSKTQSSEAFSQIQQYATHSPFSVSQTTEMAVLLKQSGVYASELQDTLKMIGDVSSGNEEKMKRIANNYAQIQAIGHATMLDMRQFAYAGLPIYEEVANHMKVSQDELRSMISDGKVTSEIIEQVFKKMTGEGGTFNNAVMMGAQTLAARKTNLEDTKNIALSNWGDWMWNKNSIGDATIANTVLGFKESFWSQVGAFGKQLSVNQNEKMALSSKDSLKYLTDAYEKALKTNNQPLAALLSKEIAQFKYANMNEKTMTSSFNQKFEQEVGLNRRKLVSDDEYDLIQNRITEIQDALSGGNIEFSQINGANAELQTLQLMLSEMIKQSEFDEELVKLQDKGKDYLVDAYYKTKNEKWEQSIVDSMNKLASGANSLNSLTAKYNAEYKNSKEGKEEEKKKKESEYTEYVKDMNRFLAVYDSKKNRLKTKGYGVSAEELSSAVSSGVFSVKDIKFNKDDLSDKDFKENMKALNSNFDDFKEQLEQIKGLDNTLELKAIVNEIRTYTEILTKNPNDKKASRNLGRSISALQDYRDSKANAYTANLIDFALTRVINKPHIAKRGTDDSGKEKDPFIPLWKRVVAGATGYDANQIGEKGQEFIKDYSQFASRKVVAGGVQGLVSGGMTSGEILLDRMKYKDRYSDTRNFNRQGEKQIDWKATEADMIKYALSMRDGTKTSALSLQGLAKAMESQVQVYEKLTVDMIGVGEDWATINKDIKGEFAQKQYLGKEDILSNAFSTAGADNNLYELVYDKEKGVSVKDKQTGELIGSIDELKKSSDNSNKALQDFLGSVKVDTIIGALDNLRKSQSALADVMNLANSIAQESLKMQKQAASLNGQAYAGGNSVVKELQNILWNSSGYKFGNASEALGNKNVRNKVKSTLGNFGAMLEELDAKNISYEDFQKSYGSLGLSEEDFGEFITKAGEYKDASSLEEKGRILEVIFERFAEVFKTLVLEAENLVDAEKTAHYNQLADNRADFGDIVLDNAMFGNYRKGRWEEDGRSGRNTFRQQMLLNDMDMGDESFHDYAKSVTSTAFASQQNIADHGFRGELGFRDQLFMDDLLKNGSKELEGADLTNFEEAINSGNLQEAEGLFSPETWEQLTENAAQFAEEITTGIDDVQKMGNALKDMVKSAALDAISSSAEIMGESFANGTDATEALKDNMKQIAASLLSNAGKYLTMAGLNLAARSTSLPMILAGLGIAAAGTGMSFLSGMLQAKGDENKDDNEMERLLNIKKDLTDLLKQAREDSIYYESTTRHQKALSANDSFTTKKVNDAIITPSGDVISTHPDDYLIATKTPQTLVNGHGGAPTINFSVVDKSTGIKVTQQKSTYDEDTNSVNFEAIIESKVQEIIASSKGDEAFAAREMRIRGRSVIA